MEITILMLQLVIIIILFRIFEKTTENKNSDINISNQNISQKEMEIFKQGVKQNWFTVNICLYKMYTELDILDYDSLQIKLQQTIEELTSNPQMLDEWGKKFNDYLKDSKGS